MALDKQSCGLDRNPTPSSGSTTGFSWMDYTGGLAGDSTFVGSTEIIPYNDGEYYREIQSDPYVDKYYQTYIGGVLGTLLVTRGD